MLAIVEKPGANAPRGIMTTCSCVGVSKVWTVSAVDVSDGGKCPHHLSLAIRAMLCVLVQGCKGC